MLDITRIRLPRYSRKIMYSILLLAIVFLVNYNLSILLLALVFLIIYNFVPRKPVLSSHKLTIFENDYVKVEKVGDIRRLAVSYVRDNVLYATEDHFIYRSSNNGESFSCLGHIKKVNPTLLDRIKDFVARLRISRNIRKNFGANQVVVLGSGTILVFFDHIYRSTNGGLSFSPVFSFIGSVPLDKGIAVDKNDNVYFGEYDCTKRPNKPRIFRGQADGTRWEVCYEFPEGKVFHVHSIKYDHYRDRLWICTGDRDKESNLMYTDDNFKRLSVLGGGDQGWRIVSLIPTDDFLYWGSDDDQAGASIYRFNFSNGTREKLVFIGKPSYYATKLKDGTLIISTTYEPESYFTIKDNPEPATDIWISKDGRIWFKILTLPQRKFKTPFGYSRARIALPAGDYSSELLFFTPKSTLDADFTFQKYCINWKTNA